MKHSHVYPPREYSDLYPPKSLPELLREKKDIIRDIDRLNGYRKHERELRGFWLDELKTVTRLISHHQKARL